MPANPVNYITGERERLAYTAQRWLKEEFVDHYWNNHPIYVKLREKDNILSGGLGEQCCVNMTFADPTNPTPRGVVDPLTSAPRNVLSGNTRLKLDTAQVVFNFSIDKRELRLQGSATKQTDYTRGQLKIAKNLWDTKLMSMIWAPEGDVGSAGGPSSVASLRTLMNKGGTATTWTAGPAPHPAQLCAADSGGLLGWDTTIHGASAAGSSPITTIGNISRNVAGAVNACVPVFNGSSGLASGKDSINRVWLASGYNNHSADLAVTHRDFYGAVMSILQDKSYLTPSPLQKFGFNSFQWNGIDWIYDDNMPVSTISGKYQLFMINTDNLQIFTDSREPEVTTQAAVDAPVYDYQWEWYGQLVPLHLGRGLGARATGMSV